MKEDLQSTCAQPENSTRKPARIDSEKINVNISSNELVQTFFNSLKNEDKKILLNFLENN